MRTGERGSDKEREERRGEESAGLTLKGGRGIGSDEKE